MRNDRVVKKARPVMNVLKVLCIAVLGFSAVACESSPEIRALEKHERLQRLARHLIADVDYMKDPRTNLCFAYSFFDRSLALATVPCEAVPVGLLTVPTPK